MKWSRCRLKPSLNPSDTNLPNLARPGLFCTFHVQSLFAPTQGTDFRHFTATNARFSFREFSQIKKQVWERNKKKKKPRGPVFGQGSAPSIGYSLENY